MTFDKQIDLFCSKNQLEFMDLESGYVFARKGGIVYPIREEYIAKQMEGFRCKI